MVPNFFCLRIIDIIRLLFHSKRVNEIVYSSKQFSNYRTLSNSIIDKSELYEFFMKRHDELIERLSFSFSFIVCFFKNRLQSLKNEFCISNVLCHLLFCSRSPNSKSQYGICSRLFVENASDFVSSNIIFPWFIRIMKFSLKNRVIIYSIEKHEI